jgi:GTP-binding protein
MSEVPRTKPVVAIVGRPNVGKSRLFNRILNRQRSIVLDMPGVTRDRIYADAKLSGPSSDVDVVLVDTGGFDPGSEDPIMRRVLEQTQLAIDEADAIIFLTDGRAGALPEDFDIARLLRKAQKPVVVGVNKLDGPTHDDLLAEFYKLGIPDVLPVSAAHGRHVGELEELVVEKLPFAAEELQPIEEPPEAGEAPGEQAGPIRVAVIGRPNVGKSSLVNRLLGEDRHLVSEVAGTTVDAVDSLIEWQGEEFLFIDTAGIRRKRSIALRMEQYSVIAALKGLERSDVALLLLDASEPVAQQDAKVAAFSYEKGKAVILVVSKWDKISDTKKQDFVERLHQELPHLTYAPIVFTSSHTGEGFDRLMPAIRKVHKEYGRRVTTAKLNQFVRELMETNPPPTKKTRRGKIYFITQIDVRPPRFLISVNDPELFHFSYRRYLVNELRQAYGYTGAPVLIGYRSHKAEKADEKPVEAGKLRRLADPKKQATARKRAKKAEKRGVQPRQKVKRKTSTKPR